MSHYGRTIATVVLTILVSALSLPSLIFGLYLLWCWFRIHTDDVYYVGYPYLPSCLALWGVGVFSLLSGLYGAWRRSFRGLLFCFPVLLGFASIILIPDAYPHIKRSGIADQNYLSSVNSSLRVWYEANQQFPANESELNDAIARGPATWQYRITRRMPNSFYYQAGVQLPYQVIVITNAKSALTENFSQRPGVIYYCVSADRQEFWATITALQHDVARAASLRRVTDRPDADVLVVKGAGKAYLSRGPGL